MTRPAATSPEAALLDRTRSAVMNVLMAVGLGIAATGFLLRGHPRDLWLLPPLDVEQWAYGGLAGLALLSVIVRRTLGSRDRLRDPAHRADRFRQAHFVSAVVGALAVPMGFAYGWLIRPSLDGVGPFWVVALATGAMAYPRTRELADFDEPLPPTPSGEGTP